MLKVDGKLPFYDTFWKQGLKSRKRLPCFSEFQPLPGSQPSGQASQPLAIPALGSSFQGSISPGSAVSAMNGSGGLVISNNITLRGFTSNPLGSYTQSSQTLNPVPPIFQASPQAGFLTPLVWINKIILPL